MSAVDVLNILDRQIGNNYNAAPSYEQLCEARAAVSELIEATADYLDGVGGKGRVIAALARCGGTP